jgi:hypothetical protein
MSEIGTFDWQDLVFDDLIRTADALPIPDGVDKK